MFYLFLYLLLFANSTVFSAEINFRAEYDDNVASPENGLNLVPGIDQQNWDVSVEEIYEKKLRYYGFFIRRNVLVRKELKILNKDTLNAAFLEGNNKYSLLGYSDSPRGGGTIVASSLSNRPTLFVMVPGACFSSNGGKCEYWDWHNALEPKILEFQNNHSSESVLMHVIWSSTQPSKIQARQVATRIKDFLRKYNGHKWDVVLFGHSRGGIFVHEISQVLNSGYLKNLVTILLDPTASIPMGDVYPLFKPSGVKKGIAYFDNAPFVYLNINLASTKSERPIPGYDDFIVDSCYSDPGCSHMKIPEDYIKSSYFANDINYIASLKSQNREKSSYSSLETPWKNITTRDSPDENLILDIGGEIENGNFEGYVNTMLGGAQITAGQDGAAISISSIIGAADIALSKRGFQAGFKYKVADATVSINDEDLIRTRVDVAGVVIGDVSLTQGTHISVGIGQVKLEIKI